MEIEKIALEKLRPHPDNANVMSAEYLAKLRGHIAQSAMYEPLVVRPHPREPGCYQLINGHHRKMVLEQLEYTEANCLVWKLSDAETLMLLANINRLSGRDDVSKRAALLDKLSRRYEKDRLLKRLPEKAERLAKMLAVNHRPKTIRPEIVAELPVPMSFFVTTQQKQVVQQALGEVGRQTCGEDPQQKMSRGDLLAIIADVYLRGRETTK
jgi:ParB-like chromosome segregation protein Spo0J